MLAEGDTLSEASFIALILLSAFPLGLVFNTIFSIALAMLAEGDTLSEASFIALILLSAFPLGLVFNTMFSIALAMLLLLSKPSKSRKG